MTPQTASDRGPNPDLVTLCLLPDMLQLPAEALERLPSGKLSVLQLCSWSPPLFSTSPSNDTSTPSLFSTEPPNATWSHILESPPPPQDTISTMYGQLSGIEDTNLLSVLLPSVSYMMHCPLDAVLYWHKLSIAAQARASWMKARDFLEQACTIDNSGTNMPSNASI